MTGRPQQKLSSHHDGQESYIETQEVATIYLQISALSDYRNSRDKNTGSQSHILLIPAVPQKWSLGISQHCVEAGSQLPFLTFICPLIGDKQEGQNLLLIHSVLVSWIISGQIEHQDSSSISTSVLLSLSSVSVILMRKKDEIFPLQSAYSSQRQQQSKIHTLVQATFSYLQHLGDIAYKEQNHLE